MGLISVSLPSDGSTADVSDYNVPITTIVTAINGNLNNANIISGAAIDGAKLADGGITNAKLSTTGTGPGAAGTAWTPSWTNLTVGNGVNASTYIQIGKMVFCYLSFTFGTTSSMTGAASFTLPVTAKTLVANASFGTVALGAYLGGVAWKSTTTADLKAPASSGNGTLNQGTSSTVPFSWTTGSAILGYFIYEAA